ncbi:MAG: leucine-rich repeat protein [Clostridia bacterium]|nr:leucine-rich repeat protein [Clostridia bacterium]
MKNLKILTFSLFLAVIIASLCPLTVLATENASAYTEDQLIDMCAGNYAYDYLGKMQNGEALQKLYRDIDAKAKAFHLDPSAALQDDKHAFFVDFAFHGLTANEAVVAWRFYRDDHPLYYWISNTIDYSENELVFVVPEDCRDGAVRKATNDSIHAQINAFLADTKDLTSPYLFALACHDMIIDKIDYAYESDGVTPQDDYWAHSILGVFEVGVGVCESYARTFSLFLNARGVENALVAGDAGGPHDWNIAKMDDGNWYWFDLTWDDNPGFIEGIDYRYFCVNDTQNIKWIDGPWLTPSSWETAFPEKHHFYTPESSGEFFQYALPERSQNAFSADFTIRNEFTVGDFDYIITGDREVYVTKIGGAGFVSIPETVEYLGVSYSVVGAANAQDRLLKGQQSIIGDGVSGISIPKTLTFIWDYVFSIENDDFEGYVVAPENPAFCAENGVLYTKDRSVLIGFPAKTAEKSFTIPAETKFIAAGAFSNHGLEELKIHKDLLYPGIMQMGYGFDNKDFIINRPDSKVAGAFTSIVNGARYYKFAITIDCENPNYKVVDKGIYSANGEILCGVTTPAIPGKFEIASGTKAVENYALAHLDTLVSLTIPESVVNMTYGAVMDCPKLIDINNCSAINAAGWAQNVYTPGGGEAQTILEDGFAYFGNKLYVIAYYGESTDVVLPEGLKKIHETAFKGRTDIESITIPAYIVASSEIISNDIFEVCTSLKTITADVKLNEWGGFADRLGINDDFDNFTVKCKDGKIVCSEGTQESVVYGDVDGSGEVTKKDTSDLLKKILKNETDTKFDVSGDGKVNIVDVILLMKYLAGHDVILH